MVDTNPDQLKALADMYHIRMLQIDGQETAAETHAHDGNRQLSIFHKITPFML